MGLTKTAQTAEVRSWAAIAQRDNQFDPVAPHSRVPKSLLILMPKDMVTIHLVMMVINLILGQCRILASRPTPGCGQEKKENLRTQASKKSPL